MSVEIGLLLAVIAGIIGIATFFIGRQTAAKNSGEEWGSFKAELKTDIGYIKRDVSEIKSSVGENNQELRASIRRLHERMDTHERDYHNKIITRHEGED